MASPARNPSVLRSRASSMWQCLVLNDPSPGPLLLATGNQIQPLWGGNDIIKMAGSNTRDNSGLTPAVRWALMDGLFAIRVPLERFFFTLFHEDTRGSEGNTSGKDDFQGQSTLPPSVHSQFPVLVTISKRINWRGGAVLILYYSNQKRFDFRYHLKWTCGQLMDI